MHSKIIAGIALAVVSVAVFSVGCIDCDRGAGSKPRDPADDDWPDTFVMYGASVTSTANPLYSYMLRNYSDHDIRIGVNGGLDTGGIVIPKRMGGEGEYSSYTFREPYPSVTVKYAPVDAVRFVPDGIAFVRFFNR